MGCKDKTTRRLEDYNDVFADIMNVLVFDGERVVKEDELEDVDTKSEIAADDKGLRGQERDVAKFWTTEKIRLALFGLENQSAPDSLMPLRLYSYNGASYKAQIIPEKKLEHESGLNSNPECKHDDSNPKQPLYPVLTLVLYFGLDRWNAAKSLYDAIKISDRLKRFIPDMPINLVEVAWLEDEVIDKFQSDFRIVARFFKQLRLLGKPYLNSVDTKLAERIVHVLELMRMFSAYTGDPMYEEFGIRHLHNKEVNMIAFVKEFHDELKLEGRKEGRKEGRRKGLNDLNLIYSDLFKQGRIEDVQRSVQDPEYLKKIMAEFGMKEDETETDLK